MMNKLPAESPPTAEHLEEQFQMAENDLADAQDAVTAAETRHVDACTAPAVNQIDTARAFRDLEAARSKVRSASARIQAVRRAIDDQCTQERIRREAGQLEKADVSLKARIAVAKQIDQCLLQFGDLMKRMRVLNASVMTDLPRPPADVPALLYMPAVANVAALRLYGLSDGLVMPRNVAMENPFTARALPAMQSRMIEERSRLLTQYGAPAPTPDAA